MLDMSLGQSGPPATSKQVQYLLSLVEKAGHGGFRDARGPLGLTSRQASGKFSRQEASALIDLLLASPPGESDDSPARSSVTNDTGESIAAALRLEGQRTEVLRGMPAQLLAAELERRGWRVDSPD
jgi:hypothetical protein